MRKSVPMLFVLIFSGVSGIALAGPATPPAPSTVTPKGAPSPKSGIVPSASGLQWSGFAAAANDAAGAGARAWISNAELTGGTCKADQLSLGNVPNALRYVSHDFYRLTEEGLRSRGARPEVAARVAQAISLTWLGWSQGYGIGAAGVFPPISPKSCTAPTSTSSGKASAAVASGNSNANITAAAIHDNIRAMLGPTFANEPGADAAITAFASTFETRFNAWKSTATIHNLVCDARGVEAGSCMGSAHGEHVLTGGDTF